MRKKLLLFAMSLIMAFSLTACGNKADAEKSDTQESLSNDSDVKYANLQEWLDTEEAERAVDIINKQLKLSGMSVELAADGDIFIYRYYVSDKLGIKEHPQEEIDATFADSVDGQRASMGSIFEDFSTVGIELSAVRFIFCSEDGTELYSDDVEKE